MTQQRALVWAGATFVFFTAVVLVVFAVADIRMLLAIGPVVAVGAASYGVYLAARSERA